MNFGSAALPIRITWDRWFDGHQDLIGVATQAVADMQQFAGTGMDLQFCGSSWADGDWGNTGWYLDRARLTNGQISSESLIQLYHGEPWQMVGSEHIDLVLVCDDLTARGKNFVFGVASGRLSVQSVHHFASYARNYEQLASMVYWIVAHELGHILGLVNPSASNHDSRGGLFRGHCTNLCYMRQVLSVEQLVDLLIAIGSGPILCPDCRQALTARSPVRSS